MKIARNVDGLFVVLWPKYTVWGNFKGGVVPPLVGGRGGVVSSLPIQFGILPHPCNLMGSRDIYLPVKLNIVGMPT